MRLEPFKVRRGEAADAIAAAIRAFGQPTDFTQGWTSAKVRWRFYDDGLIEYGLDIDFHDHSDTISMQLEARRTSEDQTVCGPIVGKSTERLIKRFVEEIRKPWGEWSEEEIMEGPMWVHMYIRDGNPPTKAMENMMAMLSFQRPDDKWVKRYFRREKE